MSCRILITAVCFSLMAAGNVFAQSYVDDVVSQLRLLGYSEVSVSKTWLRRTRIIAQSSNGTREIIIDPRTGEILRDLFTGGGSGVSIIESSDRTARDRARDAADDLADEAEDNAGDTADEENDSSGSGGDSDDSDNESETDD